MYGKKWLWVAGSFLLWVGVQTFETAVGQSDRQEKVEFRITAQEPLPSTDVRATRILIKRAKDIRIGAILSVDGRRVFALQNAPQVILPYDLPALIARSGNMILQYGDPRGLLNPRVLNLYWLNSEGKEVGKLEEHYGPHSLVGISDDGFTAVVGATLSADLRAQALGLFTPTGERRWERTMREEAVIRAEPAVSERGMRVAAVTTSSRDPLKDHRILILDNQGAEINSVSSMGIIQRMVVVGNGKALFIQAHQRHGLIDFSSGQLMWSKEGNVRLIAPQAAAMSPNEDVLFLLVTDWIGKPQAKYRWQLKALSVSNGHELGTIDLPQEMPSTSSDVFGRIDNDKIGILFESEELSISWSR